MRIRAWTVGVVALLLVGVGSTRVRGEPVEVRGRAEPTLLRVDIEGIEPMRDLRFAGSIVQTIEAEPGTTMTTRREIALTGPLPVPASVQTWFDGRAEGRPSSKLVSLVAADTSAKDLWRWRFFDCTPTQLSYDPDGRTWTLGVAFARVKYESTAAVPTTVVVVPPRDGPLAPAPSPAASTRMIVSRGVLRVTMRTRTSAGAVAGVVAVSAVGVVRSDDPARAVVTPREGAPMTVAWADIERIEPERELSSER